MASVRLTNDLRTKIVNLVLKRRFQERQDDLQNKLYALALKVYHTVYTPEILEKMKTLGDDFFNTRGYLKFASNTGAVIQLDLKDRLIFSAKHSGYYLVEVMYQCSENDSIWEEWTNLDIEQTSLNTERKEARRELESILNKCSTSSKLFQAWPELKSLVEHIIPEPTPKQLPALPTTRLNEEYNLPVDLEEE